MAESRVASRASSRLFNYGTLDRKEEIDEKLEKCHREVSMLTASMREKETYEQLNAKVCRSSQDHDETTFALLYSILTDPASAPKTYSTLTMITRDSMATVIHNTELLILEKFPKLKETIRIQLLWLTREMIQTGVAGADTLCYAFLKQMPAGSTATQDIWLAENLVHLFLDNRSWMEGQSALVTSVLYTYLSLLCWHTTPGLADLKELETQLCVSLLRSKFLDCITIGRDLIRLLQNVSRIPAFTELWQDLMQRPEKLAPNFTGLSQVLSRRTSRRFIAGRVVTDAEIKINFLLSKVKFGQHRRYQEWLQKKYLSTPESLQVIPELVRFICCVIHPPNELLGSDIMPRWALVGWLLSLCQPNSAVLALAKLALFYDWILYSPTTDNIMNIEPAILLMFHSLHSHPQITASLLDFLCQLVITFCPSLQSQVLTGIKAAFDDIIRKGVLTSLESLLTSTKLDEELRARLAKNFPDFYPPQKSSGLDVTSSNSPPPDDHHTTDHYDDTPPIIMKINDIVCVEEDPVIKDDDIEGEDDEVNEAFAAAAVGTDDDDELYIDLVNEEGDGEAVADPWDGVSELPDAIRSSLLQLKEHGDTSTSDTSEVFQELIKCLYTDSCDSSSSSSSLMDRVSLPLGSLLSPAITAVCSDEDDPGSSRQLLHHLFRHTCSTAAAAASSLFHSLQSHHSTIGYLFLHYLVHHHDNKMAPYRQLLTGEEQLQSTLLSDLQECVQNETTVFYELLPVLYNEFSEELVGCSTMISLVVGNIDPGQLNSLVTSLMVREIQLFGKQHLQDVIVSSLQWDSFEQFCVWQLLSAEGPECHHVVPLLSKLTPQDHPEAVSGAMLLLRTEPSIPSAVGNLLSLPVETHRGLVAAVMSRWTNSRPNKIAKFTNYCLEKVLKLTDPVPTLKLMLDNIEHTMQYLSSRQLYEGGDMILAQTLDKILSTHYSLRARCSRVCEAVSAVLKNRTNTSSSNVKRRASGDSDDGHTKGKKRRVVNIEELSD